MKITVPFAVGFALVGGLVALALGLANIVLSLDAGGPDRLHLILGLVPVAIGSVLIIAAVVAIIRDIHPIKHRNSTPANAG